MKKWMDFFKEPVSDKFADQVLTAANKELEILAEKKRSLRWRWAFLSSLTTAGLVGWFFVTTKPQMNAPEEVVDDLMTNLTLFTDEDLEVMEDLDVIELLNEETGELEV